MRDFLQVTLAYGATNPLTEIMFREDCGLIPTHTVDAFHLSVALVAPYLSFYHITIYVAGFMPTWVLTNSSEGLVSSKGHARQVARTAHEDSQVLPN